MCHSKLIPSDIKRAMKDAKDIHVPIVLHEVGNPIMPVEEDANVAVHPCPRCGVRMFTWHEPDEPARRTIWWCNTCDYSATEDESCASTCPGCGKERHCLALEDTAGVYKWCPGCGPLDGKRT